MDLAFASMEAADRYIMSDLGFYGVMTGMTVAQSSPTDLSVDVASGTAYDQDGQRIRVPGAQTVDLSVDYLGASTAVAGAANAKYLSVYVIFDRDLSSPETDGNGDTVYVLREESFAFKVVQGTEALSPTKPSLLTDAILLCDVQLAFGDTAIINADLDTGRRMDLVVIAQSPITVRSGSYKAALTTVLTGLNQHILGSANQHDAADIPYTDGSGFWADGVTQIPNSGSVADALTLIVAQLGKKTATAGDDLVGVLEDSTVSPTLSGSTLRTRLVALRLATNLVYSGSPVWADGATTVLAGTIEAAIDSIVTTLGATSSTGGAGMLGCGIRTAWLGSRTNPATTIYAAIDKIIVDLAVQTSGDDGAERIGAYGSGNLTTGSVRSQLDELDTKKGGMAVANTWTAKQTFDLASPGVGIETASDTTADFNGEVEMPRLNVGVQDVGVIAANTQITNVVGLVLCRSPGSDTTDYNLAMPAPAAGNPILCLKFRGGAGTARRVWLTTTANIGSAPPSDYFAYWEASSNASAGAVFCWDGSRWRHVTSNGLTGTAGGGTLAD